MKRQVRTRLARGIVVAVAVASAATGCASKVQGHAGLPTIPLEGRVVGGKLAIDPTSHTLYAATSALNDEDPEHDFDRLAVIDMSTNTITATISLPEYVDDIAVDTVTHTVYLVSAVDRKTDSGLLTVVDGTADTITAKIPTGSYAQRVAVDESTHSAYVLGALNADIEDAKGVYGGVVSVVTAGANAVSAKVPVLTGDGADITVDTVSHTAYLVDITLAAIDLATNVRTSSTDLHLNYDFSVQSAEFDSRTGKLVVMSREGRVAVVDPATAKVVQTYQTVGGLKDDHGRFMDYEVAAFDSAAHTVYTSANGLPFDTDEIQAVDVDTGAVVVTRKVSDPDGLAVDPLTHTLYAVQDGMIAVYPRLTET